MKKKDALYGLMAEFDTPTEIVNAAHRAREEGYRKMDAYTPFAVEELTEALALGRSRLPLIVLIGGIVGGIGGYLLQYWALNIAYPFNIGGRPINSWPMFIVIMFECTVLVAALSSGVQLSPLRACLAHQFLPVHRIERSEIRSVGHARVPRKLMPRKGQRCRVLKRQK
jgi:hypothetical protein